MVGPLAGLAMLIKRTVDTSATPIRTALSAPPPVRAVGTAPAVQSPARREAIKTPVSDRANTLSLSPRSQSWQRTNSRSATDAARTGAAIGANTNGRTLSTMTVAPPSPTTAARHRSQAHPPRQTSGPRCGSSPHAPEPATSVSKLPLSPLALNAAVVERLAPQQQTPQWSDR